MKVYKDKQYLVFDSEDGSCVKYDFATKQAIGKSGKPVKNLKSQLRGYTISQMVNDCTDLNYAKFLNFIRTAKHSYGMNTLTNIGSILERVPLYANFEQIFSAGLNVSQFCQPYELKLDMIPKGMIKSLRNTDIKIEPSMIKKWESAPDAYYLAFNMEYTSLTLNDIRDIVFGINTFYEHCVHSVYMLLINMFGYNAKSLLMYIDDLATFEAVTPRVAIHDLYDYANMMSQISPKYDKYPRHFLTSHAIASRNYNRMKSEFDEKKFEIVRDKNYECTFGEYRFYYPNTIQDIKDEAVQQHNCVASYINNVLAGGCHILFLRKKSDPDKSLVTIEVRDNKIVQARGRFNRLCTDKENEIIEKFNKKYSHYSEQKEMIA